MYFRYPVLFICLLLCSRFSWANSDQEAKVREVNKTLQEIQQEPEKSLPAYLLQNASGIAVIPSVVKVGFVVGGRYGKGIFSIRNADGSWSNPLFLSISGGSVGWQIGAQKTDVILLFMSQESIKGIMKGQFTIGADASVSAGPVGRDAHALTDTKLQAEIYSWSRSRGLFAGLAVDGAHLQIEDNDNFYYYHQSDLQPAQIFADDIQYHPPSAQGFRSLLQQAAGNKP
ncbi:MAG: lipid-binding SYLF domain-containing protein [gamma proteobacterium symbiont of Bathyaustriella thionipta]|nr:lipid-binding SYLF domain-containing protein [gamma proteobacterium symbiont of Bathyaustriella thionipta]